MPREQFPPMPPSVPETAPETERTPALGDEDMQDVAYSEEKEWKEPEEKEIGGLAYSLDGDGTMNFGFNFNIGFSNDKTPEELAALKRIGVDAFPGTKTVDLRDLIVMEGGVRHDAGGDLLCLPAGTSLEAADDIYFTLPKSHIRCKIDMQGSSRLKNVSEA